MAETKFYTAQEVAERYRVAESTVVRWARSGRLSVYNMGGGRQGPYRITEESLQAFEAANRKGPALPAPEAGAPDNGAPMVFRSQEFGDIRTVVVDGEPWLVGKDVATALGYKDTVNALKAHVDEEDKRGGWQITTPSGVQEMTIINESGLYSLVLSSKLPGAKKFKRWVTAEVLPSIRKHGAYMTAETIEKVLSDPDTIIQLATSLKEERERRKELEAQAQANRPKVLFADAVAGAENAILIRELAKLLKQNGVDMGERRLFQWLRANGYLIRKEGRDYNLPTQRAMELGLFQVKKTAIAHHNGTYAHSTTLVTGKGQQYFVNKLLEKPQLEA